MDSNEAADREVCSTLVGSYIGVYRIDALLGVGGMGQVYRAHDTRLQRDVAIKLLPDAFASDPVRLARFEREARMLASLNHPHIGAIHGIEEAPLSSGAAKLPLVGGVSRSKPCGTSFGGAPSDGENAA